MMSTSMVSDIRDLFSSYGDSVVSRLSADERENAAFIKPLAILDPVYIKKPDHLKHVMLGMSVIWLDSVNHNKGKDHARGWDTEDYAKMIQSVFHLPYPLAFAYAQKIETLDVIGGTAGKDSRQSLLGLITDKLQEAGRRVANTVPAVLQLPYRIDQDQSFDGDALFEIYNFGKVVDELLTRVELMSAQQKIAMGTGLFNTLGQQGDLSDDTIANVVELAKASDYNVPSKVLGKYGIIKQAGDVATNAAFADIANQERSAASIGGGGLMQLLSTIGGSLPFLNMLASNNKGVARQLSAKTRDLHSAQMERNAMLGDIADKYGEELANAIETGDMAALCGEIMDIMDTDTTGDPLLDQAIIDEVTGDVLAETGDVAEVGGLLTRFRTKANMRKARRRQGKALKKARFYASKDLKNRDYSQDAADNVANDAEYQWQGYAQPSSGMAEGEGDGGYTSVIPFDGIQ